MSEQNSKFLRFPLAYRVEHWTLMAAFTTLAITGLIQKYASSSISQSILRALGGIENTRTIHHIAAIVLMVEVVYHLGVVIYRLYVKRYRLSMMPSMVDVTNAIQLILYNLGLRKTRPQQSRFTFEEKFEYWAVVWGTVIMVITGFMMWNPVSTTRFFTGQIIPAAKTAHGGEALLAVLAIIVWHLYHVIARHFNQSMFTGYLPEEDMIQEHPLELADIKAGIAERPLPPQALAQRKRIFYPVYGIVSLVLLFGIFRFVTFEQTAVSVRPPAETVAVFAPLTPTPLPTPLPTETPAAKPTSATGTAQVNTWEGGIGAIFQSKCSACHGSGTQMSGLNLGSYQSALTGGKTGPGIVPGNPDASEIVIKQSAGGHPGQLSADELSIIINWIQNGAPEK